MMCTVLLCCISVIRGITTAQLSTYPLRAGKFDYAGSPSLPVVVSPGQHCAQLCLQWLHQAQCHQHVPIPAHTQQFIVQLHPNTQRERSVWSRYTFPPDLVLVGQLRTLQK